MGVLVCCVCVLCCVCECTHMYVCVCLHVWVCLCVLCVYGVCAVKLHSEQINFLASRTRGHSLQGG